MKKLMIKIIKFYQRYISRYILTGRNCRFYPTCSQYSMEAYEKYGFFKGTFLTINRILRCNPFNKGGYDPLK
ncbi:membrane protein insertion efficiency factor YidD [Tissierella creatinophila]|uniref:Putative membrane protein insertion efficiency factor n=1 Tax=Tissierella creatinophila DSM 6911 TaxID=1123403 RepID=A0A1U7M608_TISCR|nr:membrane protein insertion efficiency factor YidD [Tissierella creatinophila]OLS02716.1 putative membrane protein insertion efficiency factor [Tissierella creatinophila DSM 6911]